MATTILSKEISIRKQPLYIVAAVLIVFGAILYDTGKITQTGSLVVVAALLFFLFLYYFLLKNKLIIDNDGVTQQLFFGKQREIRWSDLRSAELHWHYHGHGASMEWEFISHAGKKISIQPAFYSRASLKLIATAIIEKCPFSMVDKRIRNMADGKFPWYIF